MVSCHLADHLTQKRYQFYPIVERHRCNAKDCLVHVATYSQRVQYKERQHFRWQCGSRRNLRCGKNKNRHTSKKVKGSQGRNVKDKVPVVGMVQRDDKSTAKKKILSMIL